MKRLTIVTLTGFAVVALAVAAFLAVGSANATGVAERATPNGGTIVFSAADPPVALDDSEVYLMRPGGSRRRLTRNSIFDGDPDWSPDGQKIAFVGGGFDEVDEDNEVFVMNADGNGVRRLTRNRWNELGPAWSPDGKRIAFSSSRDGDFEIFVMNADGSGQRQLTRNTRDDLGSTWSPDGRRLAFSAGDDPLEAQIWVMNADGSRQRRLTSVAAATTPAWSPDGHKIAYTSGVLKAEENIYTMKPDGNDTQRITSGAFSEDPSWSPDGRTIVFTRFVRGRGIARSGDIYLIDLAGKHLRRLTRTALSEEHPRWRPRR